MYILLAIIAAAAIGVAAHCALPHRELRGVALVPAVGTAVAAALYAILTWAGPGEASPWLWIAVLAAGAVAAVATALASTRIRARSDAAAAAAAGIR
ncbi:hypothetical protein [Microbacterium sp. KNMS]